MEEYTERRAKLDVAAMWNQIFNIQSACKTNNKPREQQEEFDQEKYNRLMARCNGPCDDPTRNDLV